ncbi:MAG: riboflavin synthase [Bacteroidota bacterium]
MFTGIIEATGKILEVTTDGTNKHFWMSSPFVNELKTDQSVAHNGICLTVVEIINNRYRVTAVDETINRTNLKSAKINSIINLERCMPVNGRFDGHIVQGHVDETATCKTVEDKNGSHIFTFQLNNAQNKNLIVEKGSITINGISLTLFSVNDISFSVAIIPYTFEHTNMHALTPGDEVNIEFDIIGKYVQKMMAKA